MTADRSARLTLEVRGRELAALRLAGVEPAAPTLVFLHEGLGCIGFWRDFPQQLCAATGLAGLIWDRLGYGRSAPLEVPRAVDYLQREAEDWLPAVLAAAGIERPVLIGHSDGGTIALLLAAAIPELPRAVVTLAAHVLVEEVTLEGIRAAKEQYASGGLRARLERHHGAKTDAVFHAWADTWLSAPFRDWNVEARLPHIRAPLLVMQGRDDEYGSLAQVEAIARGVSGPVERCILDACGHVPHHQARAATMAAIIDFLKRWLQPGSGR